MTNHPNPIGTARARLGNAVKFHGRDSREAREARRELLAAKLVKAQDQADALRAELETMAATS